MERKVAGAKPERKQREYINFFEILPNGKHRKCKLCDKKYSINTSYSHLSDHIKSRHQGSDVIEIFDSPDTKAIPQEPQAEPQSKVPHLEFDLNLLLLSLLIHTSVPPSTLDSMKILSPAVQLWPKEKFQTIISEVFSNMQEDVRVLVGQVSSKMSIALDFWTSYEQLLYMSVTCHWIDEDWSFQRVLLDICHISSPKGASEIYLAIRNVLELYNIEKRVLCCTYNNCPIVLHACQALKEDLDNQETSSFYFLPCAAHTLNSIIGDGLSSTKSIIPIIREFVLKMNTSPGISQDFLQCCKVYQEGEWKFPLDASPRWSGSYMMLDIARKACKSMETIVQMHDKLLGSRLLLNATQKSVVDVMHAFFEPFNRVITDMCTDNFISVGLVVFYMDHISELIATCRDFQDNPDSQDNPDPQDIPDWLKRITENMANKAQLYNEQICNSFTYMCAILDPRIKFNLIPESLRSENHLEEAQSRFLRSYSTNSVSSITGSFAALNVEDACSVSFAEEIARKKRGANMPTLADEYAQYVAEFPASTSTDVLKWWKVNQTRYPQLSVMARDFLPVQATSLVPENLFCSRGDEIDNQRFSTPCDSTRALHCVKSWIQNGFKLKYGDFG